MAASVFDSQHLRGLFSTGELAQLFTDSAEMRAMLLVEGALAKVQGPLGVIPETSAAFLHRACMEVQIDPSALSAPTAANGVSVPAFLAELRKALEAPEHAQYLHWGATSQDILDTALMLRLKRALAHLQGRLKTHLSQLAALAETHAELPMPARTWGQYATPTSFGAYAAGWGQPLLELYTEMQADQATATWVSLSGASGTSAALGPKAAETRAALAEALGLHDPQRSWHTDRTPITRISAWATRLANALAKMGSDVSQLTMSGIDAVQITGAGGSSTMPQKQNPVAAGTICALASHATALNTMLQAAAAHTHQRDGAAWISEWLALPQLILSSGAALEHALALSASIAPNTKALTRAFAASQGLLHAEALSFELAKTMPRPDAQAATKTLCQAALETGQSLEAIASKAHPDLDLSDTFSAAAQMSTAPADARAFASAVRNL